MPIPMLGHADFWRGAVFVIERLFWRGRPTRFGMLRFRWLLPASRVGYLYPGRDEPDVFDRPAATDDERQAA